MRILKVATCSLNQWAMDFDNNMKNIKESITLAKAAGAAVRLGPELEITGYGCEDHFFEQDTITHAWECMKELLGGAWTHGLLCSLGMPVVRGVERYDCQVLCMNGKILMIRPKIWLANGGGCNELRWFTAWTQTDPQLDEFVLPPDVAEAIGQKTVPFGYGYLQFLDTAVAAEICKELFSPVQIHPQLALNGVEVFMNASGSIHQVQKMARRLNAITTAMSARGGVYVYSNHLGCDGTRFYYDGCSCIVVNGEVVGLGQEFTLKDVDMVVAQVDLDTVVGARVSDSSFQEQASCKKIIPSVSVPFKLCTSFKLQKSLSPSIKIEPPSHEEEIAKGAACWLWSYLRRSGASGFLLPLSNGVDSFSVAAIVGCMCQLVVKEIENGDEQVKADAIRIGNYKDKQFPIDGKEFASRIFCTIFMGNPRTESRKQCEALAGEIGSLYLEGSTDGVVSAFVSLFLSISDKSLRKKEDGGTEVETAALRNTEDRTRMVATYMLASLLPWIDGTSGFYLVLSSTTADDGLIGNLTKYGSSSGDLNPVGSINRQDLRRFLKWAAAPENLGYSSLSQLEDASNLQKNEEEELSTFGRLRKITLRYGPVSMFENLCEKWGGTLSPADIAKKVKNFFKMYSENRDKMTVLTPSYIVESHANEDNRFDQRQILYNSKWPYQFKKIDQLVEQHVMNDEEARTESSDSTISLKKDSE